MTKEVGERAAEGRAYTNIGAAYDSLRDFEKAIEYHELYLSIAKEVGDTAGKATAYCNLGNAHASLGDMSKAENFFKYSVQLLDNLRDSSFQR